MNMLDFTVEEINLIAMYLDVSKVATIMKIHDAYRFMEKDFQTIASSAARKLNLMTEEEFADAHFIPADDDE